MSKTISPYALLYTCLILSCSLCAAQNAQPRGYFALTLEGGIGNFAEWHDASFESRLRNIGIYTAYEPSPIGGSYRLAAGRVTKRRKLHWGLNYSRFSSSRLLNTTFLSTFNDGTEEVELVQFEQHRLRHVIHTFDLFFEPRILQRARFSGYLYTAVGNADLGFDRVRTSAFISPTRIESARPSNAGFSQMHAALGVSGRYRANRFYSLYGSARVRGFPTTQTVEVIELTLGVELHLRAGGVALQ